MVLAYLFVEALRAAVRAATDAHSDWKHGSPARKEHSLVYTGAYKLTRAIERQVNPRRNAAPTPTFCVSPASETEAPQLSEPLAVATTVSCPGRSHRHGRPQAADDEMRDVHDPPPPYPGASDAGTLPPPAQPPPSYDA